jgi:hypothetical protein
MPKPLNVLKLLRFQRSQPDQYTSNLGTFTPPRWENPTPGQRCETLQGDETECLNPKCFGSSLTVSKLPT